jgi:hypothetical protein
MYTSTYQKVVHCRVRFSYFTLITSIRINANPITAAADYMKVMVIFVISQQTELLQ